MSRVVRRRRRFSAGAVVRSSALVLGTVAAVVLSAAVIASAWWSVQRRWHGFDLQQTTYRDGEVELDHGVLRWDLRGEKPMRGFFEDLVYWSAVRSSSGPGEGWQF